MKIWSTFLIALAAVWPAQATDLRYSYNPVSGSPITASLLLTIADSSDPNGKFTVLSGRGQIAGNSATFIANPNSPNSAVQGPFIYDDLITYSNGIYLLDDYGLLFSANGILYNIGDSGGGYILARGGSTSQNCFGTYTLAVAAAVPEPGTWFMFAVGLAGIGALMRWPNRVVKLNNRAGI